MRISDIKNKWLFFQTLTDIPWLILIYLLFWLWLGCTSGVELIRFIWYCRNKNRVVEERESMQWVHPIPHLQLYDLCVCIYVLLYLLSRWNICIRLRSLLSSIHLQTLLISHVVQIRAYDKIDVYRFVSLSIQKFSSWILINFIKKYFEYYSA